MHVLFEVTIKQTLEHQNTTFDQQTNILVHRQDQSHLRILLKVAATILVG